MDCEKVRNIINTAILDSSRALSVFNSKFCDNPKKYEHEDATLASGMWTLISRLMEYRKLCYKQEVFSLCANNCVIEDNLEAIEKDLTKLINLHKRLSYCILLR